MTSDLVEAGRAALDGGCSLAELEAYLFAGRETDDQVAAAWLFAWAYDVVRPGPDDLAARITSRPAPNRTPNRSVTLDAAGRAPFTRSSTPGCGPYTAAVGRRPAHRRSASEKRPRGRRADRGARQRLAEPEPRNRGSDARGVMV